MLALLTTNSENKKISTNHKVCATYASIPSTCPTKTCMLYKNRECYGMFGNVRFQTNKLSVGTPLEAAKQEAALIDNAIVPKGRCMRMHVVGDSRTNRGTALLAASVDRYLQRGGGIVWTYTHAWITVDRLSWGNISIIASLDNIKDCTEATRKGYAVARYIAKARSTAWKEHGITWIMCPAQIKDIGCVECGVCLHATLMYKKKIGVAFAAHGCRQNALKKRIGGNND